MFGLVVPSTPAERRTHANVAIIGSGAAVLEELVVVQVHQLVVLENMEGGRLCFFDKPFAH